MRTITQAANSCVFRAPRAYQTRQAVDDYLEVARKKPG
jgi:hypothetical protein